VRDSSVWTSVESSVTRASRCVSSMSISLPSAAAAVTGQRR
jgi:hypothetical protein